MAFPTILGRLLADTDGWGHMDGWGGGWMWLWGTLMMFSWVAIIAAAIWFFRAERGQSMQMAMRPNR
ncbi:MAG: hypothetical protein WA797_09065 [Acidimicrobiales bacterium]